MTSVEKEASFLKKKQTSDILIAGMLTKEGSNWKTWKTRYFELTSKGDLTYKRSKDDTDIINKLSIKDCTFYETQEKGKPLCLKILKSNNKPFYVCAFNSTDYTQWIEKLTESGCRLIDEFGVNPQKYQKIKRIPRVKQRLEIVDVKEWNTEDICEWMSAITLRFQRPDLTKEYLGAIREARLSGFQLLQLGSEDLKKLNIKSMGQRAHIRDELDRLESSGTFDPKQMSIYLKFKGLDFSNNRHIKMGNWVESLCDAELIKQTYLAQNVDNLPIEDLVDKEELEGLKDSIKQQINVKLRIKLVITEICHSSLDKGLRMILSPIISKMPAVGEFGMFHTALIIGSYYLEWTDSSLCIPKKMVSSMALLTADIDELAVPKESLDEVIHKIAEVVTDWNSNFIYRKSSGQTMEYEGNCQDFVDDLLFALGVNPNFSGALASFIAKMREKGKCTLEFTPDKPFREKFGLKKPSFEFATHTELDEFVAGLFQKEPIFKSVHPSEYALLKSFDRGFWLRHFKSPDDKKLCPMSKEVRGHNLEMCPFGNPRDTKSMF